LAQFQGSRIGEVLEAHEQELLAHWREELGKVKGMGRERIGDAEQVEQCREFLHLLRDALRSGDIANVHASSWADLRDLLGSISASRARQGFTPTETALFVFSFKQPLFEQLRKNLGEHSETLLDAITTANQVIDQLGLYTADVFLKAHETVITRQQEDMLELSTPVVKLWEGILALPIIGTLDSSRAQVVMENLLQAIVDTGSDVAIIDITGVPTVDTLVSQHLLKTVAAARLMGADCIISGIRPQIAQTIVHLGVDLGQITTKATLADAFLTALKRVGATITRQKG
jgi:rsbT co-antagonist protein RsbR